MSVTTSTSTSTSFTVPRVDLAADPPSALADALAESSCVFIVNHGVPAALIEAMVETSTAFFDQPRERKLPSRWPGDGLWRGWQPVYEGDEDLTGGRLPDLLERFEISLSGSRAQTPAALAATFDLWPSEPEPFARIWTEYYAVLGQLAGRLMNAIITTLDLPRDAAAAWTDEHYANLVAINYIEQPVPPEPGQLRIRGHVDRGGLTLLWADQSPGGLEVLLPRSRSWVPVMIPPDAFLVQAGDLLTRWTNRVIKSNIHRVVNPPAAVAATSRRLSVPYFHYPRLDLLVEAAPACVSADRRAPHPVIAGDHVFRRQEDYKDADIDGVEQAVAEALAQS